MPDIKAYFPTRQMQQVWNGTTNPSAIVKGLKTVSLPEDDWVIAFPRVGGGRGTSVYIAQNRCGEYAAAVQRVIAPDNPPVGQEAPKGKTLDQLADEIALMAEVKAATEPFVCFREVGQTSEQFLWMLEPLLGATVQGAHEEILRFITASGAPSPQVILARGLLCALLRAVAELHQVGKVHQDLKPANVIIQNGQLCLIDFEGSANILTGAERHRAFAQPGVASVPGGVVTSNVGVGRQGYEAPEQVLGGIADASTDMFSLGLFVLWSLLGEHRENVFSNGLQDAAPDVAAYAQLYRDFRTWRLEPTRHNPAENANHRAFAKTFSRARMTDPDLTHAILAMMHPDQGKRISDADLMGVITDGPLALTAEQQYVFDWALLSLDKYEATVSQGLTELAPLCATHFGQPQNQ